MKATCKCEKPADWMEYYTREQRKKSQGSPKCDDCHKRALLTGQVLMSEAISDRSKGVVSRGIPVRTTKAPNHSDRRSLNHINPHDLRLGNGSTLTKLQRKKERENAV